MVPASHVDAPTESESVVVFVRPSTIGEGYAFPIVDEKGSVLAYASAQSQFAVHLPPGEHHLTLGIHGSKGLLSADLVAGRTYYVTIELRAGTWVLAPVHRATFPSIERTLASTPAYRVDSRHVGSDGVVLAGRDGRDASSDPESDVDAHTLRAEDGR